MTTRRLVLAAALFAASTLTLVACGGTGQKTAASFPIGKAADFPSAKGKSLRQVMTAAAPGPMMGIAAQDFTPGRNRFAFILVSPSRKLISGVPVALYLERSGDTKVLGPYLAREEAYAVKPQFVSETVKNDPNAVSSIYVTQIKLPKPGVYAVTAFARLDGQFTRTQPGGINAAANDPVPQVGQVAPKIDTPTAASVNGNLGLIDTRKPHDTMHDVNFADVYKKKPIVLLFATPALCQSRTCGPVTDVAEQVKSQYGKQAAFIHMEVYLDNEIKPGCLEGTRPDTECYRPQFLAYHLPSEPWAFGIDRKGRVAARIEGPFGTSDLVRLVKTTVQR